MMLPFEVEGRLGSNFRRKAKAYIWLELISRHR